MQLETPGSQAFVSISSFKVFSLDKAILGGIKGSSSGPFRSLVPCLLNQPNHWIVLDFWIHLGPLAIACWSLLQGVWTAGHRQFQGFPWSGTRPLTPTVVFWAESQKRKTLCKADCAKGMKTIELWFSISAISAESLLECTPAKPWQGKGQPYVWVAELWWTVSKWINSHFIGKLSSRKYPSNSAKPFSECNTPEPDINWPASRSSWSQTQRAHRTLEPESHWTTSRDVTDQKLLQQSPKQWTPCWCCVLRCSCFTFTSFPFLWIQNNPNSYPMHPTHLALT